MKRVRQQCTVLLTATVLLGAMVSARAEIGMDAYVGGGYSDNLGRAASGKQGEAIFTGGGNFRWQRQGTRLSGNVAAGFDWYRYGGDLFSDEFLGHAIADLRLAVAQDRVSWVIADGLGQVAVDPLVPTTAANRQNVNVLSTGPDLMMHLGTVTTLTLSGRYNDTRYEASPADYNGWSGLLVLAREMSATSTVSVGGGREHVDYREGVLPNYDRDQAYLEYLLRGGRTLVDASLGWSRMQRDSGGDDSEPLLRLAVSRNLSARSTLSVSGTYGLSTGGEIFRSLQPVVTVTLPGLPDATVGDAARQTLVRADWTMRWERTTLAIGANVGKERYANVTSRDVERGGASLQLDRTLTPALHAGIRVNRERRDFTALGRVFNDTDYALVAERRLGRSLSVALELDRYERSDTLQLGGYTENVGFLRLKWAKEE